MLRRIVWLLFVPLVIQAQEAPELFTKSYIIGQVPVLHQDPYAGSGGGSGFGDPFGFGGGSGKAPGGTIPKESTLPWARKTANPKYLEEYVAHHTGVTFPEGAWIRYQHGGHVLHMHNTLENHDVLQLGLMRYGFVGYQVEITLRIASFEEEMIDKMERMSDGPLTDAQWVGLWKGGKGETLASQSIKTIDGVNTIIECVEEVIYPTEMEIAEVKEGSKGRKEQAAVHSPEGYGGLETREVGVILNTTPTVGSDMNTINLVLLPEKADAEGNNPDLPDAVQPMSPIFRSLNLTTSLIIENNSTLVIANSTDVQTGKRMVLMLHARLTNSKGEPVKVPLVIPDSAAEKETP